MKKITHKHVGAGLVSAQKGITLIALVITIIILLILAGVAINLVIGDNGIINHAKRGGVEYTKAQLKEEIEQKITAIEMDKLAKGGNIERTDLNRLSEIGADVSAVSPIAIGEYKSYEFTVDEKYKVTIGEKLEKDKPTGKAEVITNVPVTIGEEVEIKVTSNVKEGTITSIEATNGATLKEGSTDIFIVTENGTYNFKITASSGKSVTVSVEVNIIKEIILSEILNNPYTVEEIASNKDNILNKVMKNSNNIEEIFNNTNTYINAFTSHQEAMTILGQNTTVKQKVINSSTWSEQIASSEYRSNFSEYFVYSADTRCASIGGRTYYKKNDGFALSVAFDGITAEADRSGTGMMLISTNIESIRGYCSYDKSFVTPDDNVNTTEFNGQTWYHAYLPYGFLDKQDITVINAKNIGTKNSREEAVLTALNDFFGK